MPATTGMGAKRPRLELAETGMAAFGQQGIKADIQVKRVPPI
jgi:hypothetical protein